MRKTDIYNVINKQEYIDLAPNMYSMSMYLSSQNKKVSSNEELFLLTKKVEEFIALLNDVGEISLK